jgi:hypothetical protein
MVHDSFCFSTRFLLSHGPVNEPCSVFALSHGTCCCPPMVHGPFCFSTRFLRSHCMNPASLLVAPRSCWFFNGFLVSFRTCCCSLWFLVLSVSPQDSFCLMVHCVLTLFLPCALRSWWFFNGFLLSLRSCCCSSMVHGSFSI